ncbi:MAG: hypothetical protein ABI690_14445 [Chloroflexota bacterium]
MMQSQATSVPFVRKYWSLLLTVGFLCIVGVWIVVWSLALGDHLSLHWVYTHLDTDTSFRVIGVFVLLALAVIIGMLLRAFIRAKAYFRWRAFLFALVILPIFILGVLGPSEYESVQTQASVSLDGHIYQLLEFKDFMDPHYTLLECDTLPFLCRSAYTYNLGIICSLSDPQAQADQILADHAAQKITLAVDPAAHTLAAQVNGQPFFTYNVATQRGIGPCGK